MSSPDSVCYVGHNSTIEPWSQVPCGDIQEGVQSCCQDGDICLENSMCHFTHPLAHTSGYYTGGCTDPDFIAPVCLSYCGDKPTSDVAYNRTTDLWACCYGLGVLNCDLTNDQTFQAPPPESLTRIVSSTVDSSSSSTSTSSATKPSTTSASTSTSASTATLPSASSPAANVNSGLSGGAKAGIGVGVAIAGLVLLGILLISIQRLRRRRSTGQVEKKTKRERSADKPPPQELDTRQQAELDSKTRSELDSRMRLELDGQGKRK